MNHQECSPNFAELGDLDRAAIHEIATTQMLEELDPGLPYDRIIANLATHIKAENRVKHMADEHWEGVATSENTPTRSRWVNERDGYDLYDSAFGVLKVRK